MNTSKQPNFAPAPRSKSPSRLSFTLKVIFFVVLLASLTFLTPTLYVLNQRKEALYSKAIKRGQFILEHLANSARIPLLADDTLSLTALIKDMPATEGLLYAVVVDRNSIVKAHSDPTKNGTTFTTTNETKDMNQGEGDSPVISTLPSGNRVLDLSEPVMFKDSELGSVHVGLSLDVLQRQIQEDMASTFETLFFLGVVVLTVAVGTSLFLLQRFTRSFAATQGLGKESYHYSARKIQNNKPGSPAKAFNDMAPLLDERLSDQGVFLQPERFEAYGHNSTLPENSLSSNIRRSQITVLFAGIKGFKDYAETRDPEEVLMNLNEYFAVAIENIVTSGGYIDKFIGDAVIGIFGFSAIHTNHSERAIRCAVAMQKQLQNGNMEQNHLLGKVGIGISTGVVLIGNIGSDPPVKRALIGESFKVASSLHVMARPGEIVMSKEVYQSVENLVSVEPLPPREIIDQSQPWEHFRFQNIVARNNDA